MSWLELMTCLPNGWKSTLLIVCSCPFKAIDSPPRLHNFSVASADPVTRFARLSAESALVDYGWKLIEQMRSLCPDKVFWPV